MAFKAVEMVAPPPSLRSSNTRPLNLSFIACDLPSPTEDLNVPDAVMHETAQHQAAPDPTTEACPGFPGLFSLSDLDCPDWSSQAAPISATLFESFRQGATSLLASSDSPGDMVTHPRMTKSAPTSRAEAGSFSPDTSYPEVRLDYSPVLPLTVRAQEPHSEDNRCAVWAKDQPPPPPPYHNVPNLAHSHFPLYNHGPPSMPLLAPPFVGPQHFSPAFEHFSLPDAHQQFGLATAPPVLPVTHFHGNPASGHQHPAWYQAPHQATPALVHPLLGWQNGYKPRQIYSVSRKKPRYLCNAHTLIGGVCPGDPQPSIAKLNRALHNLSHLGSPGSATSTTVNPRHLCPARVFEPSAWLYPSGWKASDMTTTHPINGLTLLACPGGGCCPRCGERAGHGNTLVVGVEAYHDKNAHASNKTIQVSVGAYFGPPDMQGFNFRHVVHDPSNRHVPRLQAELTGTLDAIARVRGILSARETHGIGAQQGVHVIIKTSSVQLVNGATEDVGLWEARGWKTVHKNRTVANADLWRQLAWEIRSLRKELDCMVWFWRVDKGNRKAGDVAREQGRGKDN